MRKGGPGRMVKPLCLSSRAGCDSDGCYDRQGSSRPRADLQRPLLFGQGRARRGLECLRGVPAAAREGQALGWGRTSVRRGGSFGRGEVVEQNVSAWRERPCNGWRQLWRKEGTAGGRCPCGSRGRCQVQAGAQALPPPPSLSPLLSWPIRTGLSS